VVWSLWLYRFVASHRAGPIVNAFRTSASVVVPSYHADPDILLKCPETWRSAMRTNDLRLPTLARMPRALIIMIIPVIAVLAACSGQPGPSPEGGPATEAAPSPSQKAPAPTQPAGNEPAAPRGDWPDDAPPAEVPAAWLRYAQPEPLTCPPATVTVGDAVSLADALEAARPGTVILLKRGTYAGKFMFRVSGSDERPIWLCGEKGAVIDGGGIDKGYGLHLDRSAWINVIGLTVRNAQKGIMVDGGKRIRIQDCTVRQVGDEGIHLRANTVESIIQRNTVSDTGKRREKFGEGIYIGTAESNWRTVTGGAADASDRNLVIDNVIRGTTAEAIDVKEGTSRGVLARNTFDGSAMTEKGGDSWVDVKGNGWLVADNQGTSAPRDGYQTHEIVDGWGNKNIFAGNKASKINKAPQDGQGVGVGIRPPLANVVTCTNTTEGDPASNVECVKVS
jgi:Right handed beta helix region